MTRDFGAHFNQLSEVYDGYAALASDTNVAKYLTNAATKFITEPILDLGVGTGNFAALFKSKMECIWGLDLSMDMLKIAASKGINPVCGNSTSLPFASNSFNTIIARQFLQYLGDNELKSTFNEVRRTLSPGGFLILNHVTSPTNDSINALRSFMSVNGAVTNFFTKDELSAIVVEHGFELCISDTHSTKVTETPNDFCGVRNIDNPEIDVRLSHISSFADFELKVDQQISYTRHYSFIVARKPNNPSSEAAS